MHYPQWINFKLMCMRANIRIDRRVEEIYLIASKLQTMSTKQIIISNGRKIKVIHNIHMYREVLCSVILN